LLKHDLAQHDVFIEKSNRVLFVSQVSKSPLHKQSKTIFSCKKKNPRTLKMRRNSLDGLTFEFRLFYIVVGCSDNVMQMVACQHKKDCG